MGPMFDTRQIDQAAAHLAETLASPGPAGTGMTKADFVDRLRCYEEDVELLAAVLVVRIPNGGSEVIEVAGLPAGPVFATSA